VPLAEDLDAIAALAEAQTQPGERLVGVIPAEPDQGARTYLCSFEDAAGERSWLALDESGAPLTDRALVRAAVSISALCELAEEIAGGGQLDELRQQLVALRLTENPPGIDEAEVALGALEATIAQPPRLASAAYLDAVGAATRDLERALGDSGGSPFAAAMQQAIGAVDELVAEVERTYKGELA
jgi:hypothetical protein